jgi:hypothetical protein
MLFLSHLLFTNFAKTENSLELCILQLNEALGKAGLIGNEIDAWFIGPQLLINMLQDCRVAKLILPIRKSVATYSLISACVGFNINYQMP